MNRVSPGFPSRRIIRQITGNSDGMVTPKLKPEQIQQVSGLAAQRATAYPESFRLLLNQLGIDLEKEGGVYECDPDGPLRVYGG